MRERTVGKKCQEWATPDYIAERCLQAAKDLGFCSPLYQWFNLDVAASHENTKASFFFSKEENGLVRTWDNAGLIWCNPPYESIMPWVKKAAKAQGDTRTFLLVPASTGTRWFSDAVSMCAHWFLFYGRISFIPPDEINASSSSIDSALFLFGPKANESKFSGFISAKKPITIPPMTPPKRIR